MPSTMSIWIFSIFILILSNIFYKIMIDHKKVREIKTKQKEYMAQWKKLQKEGNMEEAKKIMSESMSEQNKIMKMTLKPMLISLVIFLFTLPALASAFISTVPIQTGNIDIGGSSVYMNVVNESISLNNETPCTTCRINITNTQYQVKYIPEDSSFFSTSKGIEVEKVIAVLPVSLPLFGEDVGWFGWYILVSFASMFIIKKLMKVEV
ncbi:MAG: DUF106 domain-containing protein [Candidatus Aenigmarchaeota archaeon]|nr:DUF106 domain-containing protein [Candidatus Aenigmarchaeota archaeon]